MEYFKIRNRGVLLTFYELNGLATNVYIINANEDIFLIDTFLGADSMKPIKQRILEDFPNKNLILVNSHYHWDHIWGNCEFSSAMIISHKICRENIEKYGADELEKFANFKQGKVELVYPNLTFEKKIEFHHAGIEIFHSPGHTKGSASLYDKVDKVLFVGDNVEPPIPYLCNDDFDSYINTLENYLELDFEAVVAGHCEQASRELIEKNLQYIKDFREGNTKNYKEGIFKKVHMANVKSLMDSEKR